VVHDAINSQLVLTLKDPYDISHFTFYQRLYNGFYNQVSAVSIWLYDENGDLISNEQNLRLPRAGPPMAIQDTFGADVELSHTVSDVKRIEIYITETDDNDDSGFSEISIVHRCASPPPSPPPSPSPAPSPPVSPSPSHPSPEFEPSSGSIAGTVIAAAWPGQLGNTGPPANITNFTETQCASYCGAFQEGSRAQFYRNVLSTLPHMLYQCTCYNASSWTIHDASHTSGFVHGRATGPVLPALFRNTAPQMQVETGHLVPSQGYIANIDVPPTTTAFDIRVTLTTDAVVYGGNVFKISPWRINDCRPCLHISSDLRFQGSIYFSEVGWWKFATATTHAVQPSTQYTIRLVLNDRKLRMFVDYGDHIKVSSMAEGNAGLALAGEFPHHERTVLYVSKDNNGNIAGVTVDMGSLQFHNSVDSQKAFEFNFDTGAFLKNSIRYHVGFEAPSLAHASELEAYAAASPSTALSIPYGYKGAGAGFDRHAALVLQTSEEYLKQQLTLCLWMKRFAPIDTLFTTLAGFGEDVVLHYAAYFSDVSFGVGDDQLRADPTPLAEPGTRWAHVCASYATGGLRILYVNGTRVGSSMHTGQVSSQLPFAIGASLDPTVFHQTGNDRGFGGVLDEVDAWARQLSDAEVRTVFVG
jgi:hypothetical protein